jgi:hypothetical protein
LNLTRALLTIAAGVLVLAGCARTASPVVPQAVAPQAAAPASSTSGALLYVSESGKASVGIYSYPALKLVGSLRVKSPKGLCVDPSSGNVWIVSGPFKNRIHEFARGGTQPIRVLKLGSRSAPAFIDACAVNPVNGDLAVVSTIGSSAPGGLFIFKNGTGTPQFYQDRAMFAYGFVGYDSSGNAFVDGTSADDRGRLAELPAGGTQMQDVTPKGLSLRFPGGVQSDGTGLAVGDELSGVIYRISGNTITGTTRLDGACVVQQFFIDTTRGVVIAPVVCQSKAALWIYRYPAGGAPIEKLTGLSYAFGVVISR